MFQAIVQKFVGTKHDREMKRLQPLVDRINGLEPQISALSDSELVAQTAIFKQRLSNGETLDALLPEAFATVRAAAQRVYGMRHYDVQLIGGTVLHEGKIAEMKTGEGKTLMATLPVYLNALSGKGVHVVTVNDYLAKRDAEWMGQLYQFLGLTVGVIASDLDDAKHGAAYRCDCTYGTNNEFGFDYLRDNMKFDALQFAQRPLNFAIVDEVDSILIDEARTPLIISGPAELSTELYYRVDRIMPQFKRDTHFSVDEKSRSVLLNDDGVRHCEELLGVENLYDPKNISLLHHVNQSLRAHSLYQIDDHYVIQDGKIVIVDEFTGRLMSGRRWGDGLHQAVEAKEGVTIENENQTLASITFQNYFRMYDKLSGMTGTADTEAEEFHKTYGLDVTSIPTNRKLIREDRDDLIFKTQTAKYQAVMEEIRECQERGQPVLVGTTSIEKSEELAGLLKRNNIRHHVLNAKQHTREAEIVSQAGRKSAVTISTNMAGRGTDIMLGGNPEFVAQAEVGAGASAAEYAEALKTAQRKCAAEREEVMAAGGLYILGTERHESRRIDNQLRGRAGRQGDPGVSCFYLSLEDDLLRIFGGERIKGMMERMGMEDDEVIEHRWLNRAIENSQHRVEQHNFSGRKQLLEYDDVMNQQRTKVYAMRNAILSGENLDDTILDFCDSVVGELVDQFVPERLDPDAFDSTTLCETISTNLGFDYSLDELPQDSWSSQRIGEHLYNAVENAYHAQRAKYGEDMFGQVGRFILLSTLDQLWKEHLLAMDHLKEGIHLRGYAQKDPLLEYKKEGFEVFTIMLANMARDIVSKILRVEITTEAPDLPAHQATPTQAVHPSARAPEPAAPQGSPIARQPQQPVAPVRRHEPKVGRNDPCPCGSGKKYKKCCG